MKKCYHYLLYIILFCPLIAISQNSSQQSAWGALFHSQKLSEKTGLHFDAQFRSADDVTYVRNILLRPGFTYFFDKNHNATLGYAYILTNQRVDGLANSSLLEHRIWQQFVLNYKIGKVVPLAHRLRLEQRFIEQNTGEVFSQRIRYFFRSVIPLQKQETSNFSKGVFLALQNEVFLNIQNKNKLNTHVFDQNRAYLAAGYRLSPAMDLEAGYLNQHIKGVSNYTTNHVVQLALYTRF